MSARGGLNHLRNMCQRKFSVESNKNSIVKVAKV